MLVLNAYIKRVYRKSLNTNNIKFHANLAELKTGWINTNQVSKC